MRRELEGLRLLIVGNWPPPLGGVSVHVRALRDAARKAGAHVTVIDLGHGQNEADGVLPSGDPLRFAERLWRSARDADLLHLHTSGANPKSWALTAGVGLVGRALSRRTIVTFHSGHCPRYLRTTTRAVMARASLASFSRVICVSEEISRALTRIGAGQRRHLIAPAFGLEGVAPSDLPPGVEAILLRHTPIISAMLAPGRDYGARELFAAFAALRQDLVGAALVVYGAGTDWSETEKLAVEAGAFPVLRLGAIERPSALALMQASDLFVRPTLVDGDSVSVREALAVGRRVVATRVGNRPRGVTLCAPGDSTDLARAMAEALSGAPPPQGEADDGIDTVLRLYARVARLRAPRATQAA